MDITTIEKDSLPVLLNKFEECASVINYHRSLAYKIVSIIHKKELLQKKENYTKEQLSFFENTHHIEDPWNCSTKDILETMYAYFSWGQYVKYGSMVDKLDINFASKLSEGGMVSLYRLRENLHTLLPYLTALDKKVITEEDVFEAKELNYRTIKRKKKSVADIKVTIPKEMLDKAKIRTLNKGYRESLALAKRLEKDYNSLRDTLQDVTAERNDLRLQVRQLRNEMRR